jgi:hypothetical protein
LRIALGKTPRKKAPLAALFLWAATRYALTFPVREMAWIVATETIIQSSFIYDESHA